MISESQNDRNNFDNYRKEIRDETDRKIEELNNLLTKNFETRSSTFLCKLEELKSRFDVISDKLIDIETQSNKYKFIEDSLNDLKFFKQETHQKLTTVQVQSDWNHKTLKETIQKYDKIYIDNLFIPGLVGENCRFRNLKEFIESSFSSLTTLTNFKEQIIDDFKSNKNKIETILKTNSHSQTMIENSLKNFISVNFEINSKMLQGEINTLTNQINEIKLDNNKTYSDFKNSVYDLRSESQKVSLIHKEITEIVESKYSKISNYNRELKKEFDIFRKKFDEIAQFVKDVRFKKNLGETINNFRRISNSINNQDNLAFEDKFKLPEIKNEKNVRKGSDGNQDKGNHSDEEKNVPLRKESGLVEIICSPKKEMQISKKRSVMDGYKGEIFSIMEEKSETNQEEEEPVIEMHRINRRAHFSTTISHTFRPIINNSNENYVEVRKEAFENEIDEKNPIIKKNSDNSKNFISKLNKIEKDKLKITSNHKENEVKNENIAYFFDKLNELKKEIFGKCKQTEIKLSETDISLKKMIEGLENKIKLINILAVTPSSKTINQGNTIALDNLNSSSHDTTIKLKVPKTKVKDISQGNNQSPTKKGSPVHKSAEKDIIAENQKGQNKELPENVKGFISIMENIQNIRSNESRVRTRTTIISPNKKIINLTKFENIKKPYFHADNEINENKGIIKIIDMNNDIQEKN